WGTARRARGRSRRARRRGTRRARVSPPRREAASPEGCRSTSWRSLRSWNACCGHGPVRKIGFLGRRRGLFGAASHELDNVIDAGAEHDAVDEDEENDRGEHAAARDRRGGVGGAQDAVNGPGLAADLSGEPAGENGEEAERR